MTTNTDAVPSLTKCIEWPGNKNKDGYGTVKKSGKMYLAHRAIYCQHNGVSLDSVKDLEVRHACDNRGCINPEHLSIGTHVENMRDMVDRGRNPCGERNGSAKLTAAQVSEIRAIYASGIGEMKFAPLAKKYGVANNTIRSIVQNTTWTSAGDQD